MVDISEFIQTTTFRGIRLGMSIQDYIHIIGELIERNRYYLGDRQSFSYFMEEIEFMFILGELHTISFDPSRLDFCITSQHKISNQTSLTELISILEELDIEWTYLQQYTFGKQLALETKQKIKLYFMKEDKDPIYRIAKIQCSI